MNTYLVNYQFKGHNIQVGSYQGKTVIEAVEPLEKAGALIYSISLIGKF